MRNLSRWAPMTLASEEEQNHSDERNEDGASDGTRPRNTVASRAAIAEALCQIVLLCMKHTRSTNKEVVYLCDGIGAHEAGDLSRLDLHAC